MATNYTNMTANMKKLAASIAAKKAAATPKPATILASTSIGKQLASTAAKNVGVKVAPTLSVAASSSAKAYAANDAAYASRSADLQRAAANAAEAKKNATNAAAAKAYASRPAAMQKAAAIAKTAATRAAEAKAYSSRSKDMQMAPPSLAFAPTSPTTIKQGLAANPSFNPTTGAPKSDAPVTTAGSAGFLQDTKASADTSAWLNDPGRNKLINSIVPKDQQDKIYNSLIGANQPDTTQVQNPMDILAGTPIGQQMQRDTYNNVVAANTPAPSSPSGGGSSSGSGSGGNDYTAGSTADMLAPVSTDTGSTASDAAATATTETPAKAENPYFNALLDLKFEYNPATDQGYLQAAAQAENAIIQSIIGRGGLYSSVAQSAVATKLTDLGIEYEKIAYSNYTDQRTYLMQPANFEQDRIDTEWEQNYKVEQSAIDFEQQRFENQLSLANFQFAQEKEAFDQNQTLAAAARASASSYSSGQASSAKAATAASEASIQAQLTANQLAKNQLSLYTAQWAKDGTANKAVASYFSSYGVQYGSSMTDYEDVITAIGDKLNNEAYQISQAAIASGEEKIASQYLDDYMKPVTTVKSGTSADTSSSTQLSYYYTTLAQLTGKNETAASLSRNIKSLANDSKYAAYRTKMGNYYFEKLLSELNSERLAKIKSEASASSGF